ncbi:site-specific integrase [Sinomonas halotolerans]|uniref:Site-specific integrase n=1 Tax=Sinomonas halotolerans TaxID=1644133 RepID=A0ABU9WVZ2_9MICC
MDEPASLDSVRLKQGRLMGRPPLGPGEVGEIWTSSAKNAKGLYRAQATYVDTQGVQRVCRVERPRKGDARAALAARLEKLLKGVDQAPAQTTVERAVWDWLNSRPSRDVDIRRGISPQTRGGYAEVIHRAVVPELGHISLEELTARHIQDALTRMVRDGTRYTEARHALTILRQSLRYAELGGLIRGNPARACDAPEKRRVKPRALSDEELQSVRAAAHAWQHGGVASGMPRSEHLADVLGVMLGLGVRIGEALALRWSDVDLEQGLVHVRGTLVEQRAYRDDQGRHVEGRFFRQEWRKSGREAPELVVEAPDFVMEILGRRRLHSPRLNPIDAVFVTRNGTWVRPAAVRTHFRKAKEAAGLEVELDWAVPHKLRATALTEVSRAVGLEEAARLGGHSSHRVTERHYIDPGVPEPVRQGAILQKLYERPAAEVR